ncbi:MAG: hypothetical protein II824_10425 [Bacteroidales bacterium]|nr:hypothetical protein [Bacteroidales bacterium]
MDKLQELTQKLYEQGLSKGKEEGEALLSQAHKQADELIRKAQEEAAAIIENAKKEAAGYKTKVEGDVKMASIQALQATRAGIENMVVAKAVAPVKEQLSGAAFLKEIITAVAKNFSSQQATDLSLVLPEKLQKELEPFVKNELARTLGGGVEARFTAKMDGGFKIGPKDGSYFIDLSDEAFQELIGEYLRPATKKILFG